MSEEVGLLYCSICSAEIMPEGTWKLGHNAEPINDGRCCRECNDFVVLPARIRRVYRSRDDNS